MRFAIDLQRQSSTGAVIVENVRADDLLSTKLVPRETTPAQMLPENSLRRRHVAAEFASACFQIGMLLHDDHSHSTLFLIVGRPLHPRPLSPKGRGEKCNLLLLRLAQRLQILDEVRQ